MSSRLSDALSVMLPSPQETAFLRACLLRGSKLEAAWRECLALVGEPLRFLRETGRELRRHLPLLYRNLTDEGVDVPAQLQPYLRAALVREQLRSHLFDQCVLESVQVMADADVDVTVLKGAAVSRMFFQPPFTRHCHDLDLWVSDEHLLPAVNALAARRFRIGDTRSGTTPCEHPEGLPVVLHTRLLNGHYDRLPQEAMRGRRRSIDVASGTWNVLAPADGLLHCCAHASTAGRRPHGSWVVDAHRMSAAMTADDWSQFVEVARRADLALPLLVLMRYLKRDVEATVPLSILDELARAADRVGSVPLMAVIDGAWLGSPGGVAAMFRKGSWRSRGTLVRRFLFPPAAYLRATRGEMALPRLAAEYPLRPARFFVRTARAVKIRSRPAGQPDSMSRVAAAGPE